MPTSAPGRSSRTRGFTLVELLAVLAIIAMGASLAALSLGQTADARLRSDARALGNFFNRIANEAAASGETLRVVAANGRFEVSGAPINELAPAARAMTLTQAGKALPTDTPILFPPAGGEVFELTLDYRGERFMVARDVLGRIAVREVRG